MTGDPRSREALRLGRGTVAAIVFGASAAVLTLEILAVRMLAPHVGLTIETYTTIIGVVLAGIALGAAVGGRLADETAPEPLLGALLVGGGVLAMLTVAVVAALGDAAGGGSGAGVLLALLAFLPPAAVLSAVTPAAAKLEVGDLRRTGEEVGRLSAWATAGALTGTFATGFVLVPLLATRPTVLAVGVLLILAGVAVLARAGALPGRGVAAVALVAGLVGAGATLAAGAPCDRESSYFCAQVLADPGRETGRVLKLDDLRHSYVDLANPRHLEFPYTRWLGAVLAAHPPRDALFLGGGGFTLPRHLLATRRDARATVLELDPELVDLARSDLGLRRSPRLRIVTGDARVRVRELPAAGADVVVGDAFGARSIPWHLATREFHADVARVLRRDGVYAMNVIDYGPLKLARAEVATLRRVFPHVALVARARLTGGNHILLASRSPLPLAAVARGLRRPARVFGEREAAAFAAGADALSDDHAPADQLLTPSRR